MNVRRKRGLNGVHVGKRPAQRDVRLVLADEALSHAVISPGAGIFAKHGAVWRDVRCISADKRIERASCVCKVCDPAVPTHGKWVERVCRAIETLCRYSVGVRDAEHRTTRRTIRKRPCLGACFDPPIELRHMPCLWQSKRLVVAPVFKFCRYACSCLLLHCFSVL